MLRDIRDWFEYHACVLAFIVLRFCGIYWLLVVAWKFFAREPLLYLYSAEGYTQETVPVAAALCVQLVSLAYQLLTRTAWGRAADSIVLLVLSPRIAVVSTLSFWAWAESKPAPGASYLPLAALTMVSIVGAVVVRWGPMARDSDHVRAPVSARGDAGTETTARVMRSDTPKRTFADIHGRQQLKERLLQAADAVMQGRQKNRTQPVRNGILLHGQPGNGKTIFAEALAGELRLPLLTLSYSDVASKWVGEKTSRVRHAFGEAQRHQPCVLFLDEVDSFLESRDAAGAGALKEDRDLVNALLTLMVDIRQSRVLLMAATNHLDRLDAAATREGRFDFKLEVPPPDLDARIGLLRQGLGANLPKVNVPEHLIESMGRRWSGYSTKRILAVTQELPTVLHRAGRTLPEFSDFINALRAVQGQSGALLENVRPLRELVLSDRTRRAVHNLQMRMADPEHTELQGGTLPAGVLFYGPPGTGKTAVAKALAKELAWSFLPTTGAELARDVAALNRVHAKALDLRPSVIFIDEADELLRDREFSVATESTNKLLTLMDGASDRVADVVWIAATNHSGQIDAAMLRGGRFGEKVVFELPSPSALRDHVRAWMQTRGIRLEPNFKTDGLMELLGEASIANAEAVMQAAVNLGIGRNTPSGLIRQSDILHALELVRG